MEAYLHNILLYITQVVFSQFENTLCTRVCVKLLHINQNGKPGKDAGPGKCDFKWNHYY